MRHLSIKLNTPCEFIDVVPVNPLIDKCQIKVCQVGDTPNRNGSVITKEVAREMANSLPGSPIVGRYLSESKDFEEHSRELIIEDGELKFKDLTQPYGFVDLNAKCWFQKFVDDGVEHEYLMTEGYIWTGRYPETKRIIEKGNNQSMELDNNSVQGNWSKNNNGEYEFFIINEAIISALCILGEDVEPCFEGASITKVQFSLEDNFKSELFSMIKEMKEMLSKGGEPVDENKETVVTPEEETSAAVEEQIVETAPEVVEEFSSTEEENEDIVAEVVEEITEEIVEEDTVVEEEEVIDYKELYTQLEENYSNLSEECESLKTEIASLREFKLGIEREQKQDLINKFYMLSDADKEDVVENIDSYSLEDIEAKLCVMCYRKGISFESKEEEKEEDVSTTFNLSIQSTTPAWVQSLEDHRSKK